jgi:hypothetical protein
MLIFDRRESLVPQPATWAAIRRGQRVRVWETNVPLFSYPSQIFATRVLIEEDAVVEPLDCDWRRLESRSRKRTSDNPKANHETPAHTNVTVNAESHS